MQHLKRWGCAIRQLFYTELCSTLYLLMILNLNHRSIYTTFKTVQKSKGKNVKVNKLSEIWGLKQEFSIYMVSVHTENHKVQSCHLLTNLNVPSFLVQNCHLSEAYSEKLEKTKINLFLLESFNILLPAPKLFICLYFM